MKQVSILASGALRANLSGLVESVDMVEHIDPSLTITGSSDTFASGLCLEDDTLLGESLSIGAADLPQPPSDSDPAKWFNHGLAILKRSAWSRAVEVFDQCIENIRSDQELHARAFALKGYALAKQGYIENAILCYKSSLELNGDSIEALSGLACAMGGMNRLDKGLKYSKKACSVRPENGPLRYNLGNMYLRMEDYEQAIAAYGAAISLFVGLFPAWVNLAAAHARMKNYGKAIEALDYALVLKPESRRVNVNRGIVLARLSRWEEASAALEKSIEIAPEYARSYIILSLVESCRGNDMQAISVLNSCIDKGLMLPKAYHNLGLIHSRLGNREQSLAAYMTAVQIKPEYAKAYLSMGLEYLSHEDHDRAKEALKNALSYRPSLVAAWIALADIARIDGDSDQCMESLDSALSLEPRNLEVHHRLTEYWIGKGDVSKARIHFEIVEQQDPSRADVIRSSVYPDQG